jgi:hypothetical protein
VCTEASPYECADGMTDPAGHYTIDSSRFYEAAAAAGFTVSQIRVLAARDVDDQFQSQLNVSPPLRVTQTKPLNATGISQAAQTINVPSLPDRPYGDSPFTVTVTAWPGLPVAFSAGNCSAPVSGTVSCTVTASQDGHAYDVAALDVARTSSVPVGVVVSSTVGGVTSRGDVNSRASASSPAIVSMNTITRYYLPADAAGIVSTGAVAVTLPSNTILGTYDLWACANDTKYSGEHDGASNCLASTPTIHMTRPDLLTTGVTPSEAASLSDGIFAVTVVNQGEDASTGDDDALRSVAP